jgi:uncharacterized oligopeptide transporter (OPT) family protein
MAIIVGAIAGTALSLAESMAPKHIRPWVPSSMGLGLAFVVPFQNSFSFFLGAVIATVWQRVDAKSAERYIIPIASGVVAGESLLSAGNAMWSAASDLIFGSSGTEGGGGH